MPKDDTGSRPTVAKRPGWLRRVLRGLVGGSGRQAVLPSMHEELFRVRGELTLARAELEQIRAAVGRRDIATLDELLRGGSRRDVEALIRDGTQTIPMPDGTVLCRLLNRFKFYVDAGDFGMTPHLLLDGYWQYWVTEFICRNLAQGESVIDTGAGYGYFTIIMADLVGGQGKVTAFEPNPWLHSLVARNLSINGYDPALALHRSAVSDAGGQVLRLPATRTGPRGNPFAAYFEWKLSNATMLAPTVTLDEVEPGRADFVRIGSARAAERIWAGMQGVVARSPNIRLLLTFRADACADAGAFLASLADTFPLRFVDGDSRAKPVTGEELLTTRPHATLYLSRSEPR